jgi:hypothetical protein
MIIDCQMRYTREVHRLLDVLERQLCSHNKHWVVGGSLLQFPRYCQFEYVIALTCVDLYSIADISIWPWVHALFENFDNAGEVIVVCVQ